MARELLNPADLPQLPRLKINQLVGREPTSVTSTPVTLTDADHIVLVDDDTVGGAVTVNLPSATNSKGNIYSIVKTGSSGNVTLSPFGSDLIHGSSELVIIKKDDAPMIYCNGTAWILI